jgi:hypothetical protein
MDAHLTCTQRKQVQTAMSGARKRKRLRENRPVVYRANNELQTEKTMSEKTTTIAVRVPAAVATEIEDLAKEGGQTKSDWIRDKVMQAIHGAETPDAGRPQQSNDTSSLQAILEPIETALKQRDLELKAELASIRGAINQAAKAHRDDLALIAEVGQAVEKSMAEALQEACIQVLSAIERLKNSQPQRPPHHQQRRSRPGSY